MSVIHVKPNPGISLNSALRAVPRKGKKIAQRLSLLGNPSEKKDFFIEPKPNEVYDFIRFARTEGRFAKHFDKDGNPSETLLKAKQERLENWRTAATKMTTKASRTSRNQGNGKCWLNETVGKRRVAPSCEVSSAMTRRVILIIVALI